jgi:hypothetical protein
MTKIIEIESCWQCIHYIKKVANFCKLKHRIISLPLRPIPSWCPLPDEEEKK